MLRRIVDLSVAIENGVPADPPGYELQIEYFNHKGSEGPLSAWPEDCGRFRPTLPLTLKSYLGSIPAKVRNAA